MSIRDSNPDWYKPGNVSTYGGIRFIAVRGTDIPESYWRALVQLRKDYDIEIYRDGIEKTVFAVGQYSSGADVWVNYDDVHDLVTIFKTGSCNPETSNYTCLVPADMFAPAENEFGPIVP